MLNELSGFGVTTKVSSSRFLHRMVSVMCTVLFKAVFPCFPAHNLTNKLAITTGLYPQSQNFGSWFLSSLIYDIKSIEPFSAHLIDELNSSASSVDHVECDAYAAVSGTERAPFCPTSRPRLVLFNLHGCFHASSGIVLLTEGGGFL